jgi:hypothetical protein
MIGLVRTQGGAELEPPGVGLTTVSRSPKEIDSGDAHNLVVYQ